jgi:hypothetical protein
MKKEFILTVLIISLFISCETKVSTTNQKDITSIEEIERPPQALSYLEVVSMLQHYDNTRVEALKKTNNGKEDTRENFYALEDLKAYIAYIEKLAADKKIKISGINIISAAYPNDTVAYPDKANYQTLIFMPATEIGGRYNVSFDPLYSEIGKPKLFDEILFNRFGYSYRNYKPKMQNPSMESKSMMDDPESSAANRSQISPPY